MRRHSIMLFVGLTIVLVGVNGLILDKERLIATGTKVYLELAPVDPRSLIQGDYMVLDYSVSRPLQRLEQDSSSGEIVVKLDERGVGTFARLHQGGGLKTGEQLLKFRLRDGEVRVGSGAFFFQEGHAPHYENAKYGEVRVSKSGTSVLVGLCDDTLTRIRPGQPSR